MKPRQKLQLDRLNALIEQVDRVSDERGSMPVGEWLATVMSGLDPRPINSPLYDLVRKSAMREYTGGDPRFTDEECELIRHLVLETDEYKHARVTLDQSMSAANKLMDFLHAKMKAVEVSGGLDVRLEIQPLTEAELDAFRARFDDEY